MSNDLKTFGARESGPARKSLPSATLSDDPPRRDVVPLTRCGNGRSWHIGSTAPDDCRECKPA
jgi:hypothetical protein